MTIKKLWEKLKNRFSRKKDENVYQEYLNSFSFFPHVNCPCSLVKISNKEGEIMTGSKSIKIIDDMINEERRCLKANLEKLKSNVNSMLEEFDELDGYGLYKTWEYSIYLPDLIRSRTSLITNLDLLQYRILEQEED